MQGNLLREHASHLFECSDPLEVNTHTQVRTCVTDAAPRGCIDHVTVGIVFFVHLRKRRTISTGFFNCTFLAMVMMCIYLTETIILE